MARERNVFTLGWLTAAFLALAWLAMPPPLAAQTAPVHSDVAAAGMAPGTLPRPVVPASLALLAAEPHVAPGPGVPRRDGLAAAQVSIGAGAAIAGAGDDFPRPSFFDRFTYHITGPPLHVG